MASALRPAMPQTGRVTKEATRTEEIEKNISSLTEVLASHLQRLGAAVQRLSGPWPTPEKAPPKPSADVEGSHLGRMSTLMSRQANLLSELEAITIQLEHYV